MERDRFVVHESRGFLTPATRKAATPDGTTFTVHDTAVNCRTVALVRTEKLGPFVHGHEARRDEARRQAQAIADELNASYDTA